MPFVNVQTIKGIMTAEQKSELLRRMTDLLVEIDDTDARLAVAQAEADLALAERRVRSYLANDEGLAAQVKAREADEQRSDAQLAAAQADLDRAKVDWQRRQALQASGSVSGTRGRVSA